MQTQQISSNSLGKKRGHHYYLTHILPQQYASAPPFVCEPKLSWILKTHFPSRPSDRTQFFHTVLVVTENLHDKETFAALSELQKVEEHLQWILLVHRHEETFSSDLRSLAMRSVLGIRELIDQKLRFDQKEFHLNKTSRSFPYLLNMELFLFTKAFKEYSLYEFLQTLAVFAKKLNGLYWMKELEEYTMILFSLCSYYGCHVFSMKGILNAERYVQRTKDHVMTNELFLVEMEMLFSEIWSLFWPMKQQQVHDIHVLNIPLSTHEIKYGLMSILEKLPESYRQNIEKRLKTDIFDFFLNVGEYERFVYHERFKAQSAYNAIATNRSGEIDSILHQITEVLTKPDFIRVWKDYLTMLETLQLHTFVLANKSPEILDFIRAEYKAKPAEFLFSYHILYIRLLEITDNETIATYISPLVNHKGILNDTVVIQSQKTPYILRICNEPILLWKGQIYRTHTKFLVEAFLYWIKLCLQEKIMYEIVLKVASVLLPIFKDVLKIERDTKTQKFMQANRSLLPLTYETMDKNSHIFFE